MSNDAGVHDLLSSEDPTQKPAATNFVLGESVEMPASTPQCRGYDFSKGVDISGMMEAMMTTGFQATNMARAVAEIRRMRRWRLSDVEWKEGDDVELKDPEVSVPDD